MHAVELEGALGGNVGASKARLARSSGRAALNLEASLTKLSTSVMSHIRQNSSRVPGEQEDQVEIYILLGCFPYALELAGFFQHQI